MAEGSQQTFKMSICAPIPVGHEVVVQYWEWDSGVFGTKYEIDASQPTVVDRTTGVAYGAPWHSMSFYGLPPGEEVKVRKPRPGPRVEGTVRACARNAFARMKICVVRFPFCCAGCGSP